MTLVFTEVGAPSKDIPEPKPDPIGVVLLDPFGNWEVARRDGYRLSGSGPVMGLKRSSSWLNNLPFEDSRSVFNSDEHKQIVRGANWLLYGLDEVLREWGYSRLDARSSAAFLSTITGRVFDIVDGMLRAQGVKNPEKRLREMCRSASLATGLMTVMESGVRKTVPSDEKIREHLERAYQNGMPHRSEPITDSEVRLDFRFPRLSYALRLADIRIPTDSEWQKAGRSEDMPQDEFVREVISLGRPAIFRALFGYDSEAHPRWLGDIVGHKEGTERSRFLLDEVTGVPEMEKRIESALISKGGDSPTVVSGVLNNIIKAFGSESAARLSWTAGLVAENVIAAPHRAGRSSQAAVSAEQVWLAAKDRMMMAPLMRALTESGCLVSSARGGRVTVLAPRVPEVMIAATGLAWDHGAHLPLGQASDLRKRFDTDLPTERSSFSGSDADYLVAAANHKGDRKTLWGLDAICDEPDPDARAKRAAAVLG